MATDEYTRVTELYNNRIYAINAFKKAAAVWFAGMVGVVYNVYEDGAFGNTADPVIKILEKDRRIAHDKASPAAACRIYFGASLNENGKVTEKDAFNICYLTYDIRVKPTDIQQVLESPDIRAVVKGGAFYYTIAQVQPGGAPLDGEKGPFLTGTLEPLTRAEKLAFQKEKNRSSANFRE